MAQVSVQNTTTNSVTYVGQTLAPSQVFQIPASQQINWANDSGVLAAIGSGALLLNDGVSNYTDVAQAIHLLQFGTTNTQKDSDDAILARVKQAPTGYTYLMRALEFTTASTSLINQDPMGTALTDAAVTYWDASGNQITDMTQLGNAVRTMLDFEPTNDYYIIGGAAQMVSQPTTDVRISVICAPDIPASYGGSKVMIQSVNFKYIANSDKINADGRAAKQLTYSATTHTSKLRFIVLHAAGEQHGIMVTIELYRA